MASRNGTACFRPLSMRRLYLVEECEELDASCRGLHYSRADSGASNLETHEMVIERVLALGAEF